MARKHWDAAWKVFLDPSKPWCSWFITHLLDDTFKDFDVDFNNMTALETEHRIQGLTHIADRFIQFYVDKQLKVLHIEFQSRDDKTVARRLLEYGLTLAEGPLDTGKASSTEAYKLPYSVVVNVSPFNSYHHKERILQLDIASTLVTIHYPVVNAQDKVPHIKDITHSMTEEDLFHSVNGLISDIDGSISYDILNQDLLWEACALISDYEAYAPAGIDESEVRAKMEKAKLLGKPARELWKEEGKEEGAACAVEKIIATFMRAYGWTREQAEAAIQGKGLPTNTALSNSGSVKPFK